MMHRPLDIWPQPASDLAADLLAALEATTAALRAINSNAHEANDDMQRAAVAELRRVIAQGDAAIANARGGR